MPNEPAPRLRRASNADGPAVTNLVYGILEEYGLKPDPGATDADLADIEKSYFERGGTFFVLEDHEGSIIGAYGLYPIEGQTCELRKMYLRKSHRGMGLGKFLLDSALAKAKELGFNTVTLETASVLKEAIALYESYGFAQYAPDHMSQRCDQAYVLELTIDY
jgi:putative acetyltransferase